MELKHEQKHRLKKIKCMWQNKDVKYIGACESIMQKNIGKSIIVDWAYKMETIM